MNDQSLSSVAKQYLALVMTAGLIAAVTALQGARSHAAPERQTLPLLIGLTVFAVLLCVLRLARPSREATSGVGALVVFGALLLTSAQTVLLVTLLIAIDLALRTGERHQPWFVVGFNGAQLMLAGLAAHAANRALGGNFATGSAAHAVTASLPAAVAFAAVNYGLLWGVDRFVQRLRGGFGRIVQTEAAEEASMLMIVALSRAAWAVQPWFVLLACGPLLFFWRLYQTVGRLEYANGELVRTQSLAIDGLIRALSARDNEVSGHSERVAASAAILAEAVGVRPATQQFEVLIRGALLHDVGKIGVRDAILHKPGSLTNTEWVEMRDHAIMGYMLVESYPFLRQPASIVLAHHERWDGKGYPRGLRGEEIPLGARIFAVADTFDAITSARPYRAARSAEEAVAEITRCSGTQFDPIVVRAFLNVYDQMPIGAQAELPARQAFRSA